jgi:ribonuclease HI
MGSAPPQARLSALPNRHDWRACSTHLLGVLSGPRALGSTSGQMERLPTVGRGNDRTGFQGRSVRPPTTVPHFPAELWVLPDLAQVPPSDETATSEILQAVHVVWQQQVLETLLVIWRWRHNIHDGVQQWTPERARLYLQGVLRAAIRGVSQRLPPKKRLRDPRIQLLAELGRRRPTAVQPMMAETPTAAAVRHILFFDGGSWGNPGPGGAEAAIVETGDDAVEARVVWGACTSLAQRTMTNNLAEYQGLITGLQATQEHGWQVEVVGDSSLILRQVQGYRPPRSPRLRPLYCEARRLADTVRVWVWQHHLRAFNKIADCAANIAMDKRSSAQVHHPSVRLPRGHDRAVSHRRFRRMVHAPYPA